MEECLVFTTVGKYKVCHNTKASNIYCLCCEHLLSSKEYTENMAVMPYSFR